MRVQPVVHFQHTQNHLSSQPILEMSCFDKSPKYTREVPIQI